MPSFFAPGLHALPPTPPRLHGSGKMETNQPYCLTGHSAFPPRYSQSGCEFIEQYSQATCFVKPAPTNSHLQPIPQIRNGRDLAVQKARPQIGPTVFNSLATAPILPPIRGNVQLPPMDGAIPPQYRRPDVHSQAEQRVQEEKP